MNRLRQILRTVLGSVVACSLITTNFVHPSVGLANLGIGLLAQAQEPDEWQLPIQIAKGGVYTGRWHSLSPNTPAVKVMTGEPVTIQNCQIQSAGDGIQSLSHKAQLTVRNCLGEGLNPNVVNRQKGYFLNVGNFSQVVVENNTAIAFGHGVRALNYGQAIRRRGQTVVIQHNRFQNVDGRLSDGEGGYLKDLEGSGATAIGLNTLRQANVEISWNEIVNRPFFSRVEDLVSTYGSSGTPMRPISIHNNYLQGGYGPDPKEDKDHTGAMINVGDAPGRVGYVHVYNNQVVSFENSGILVSAGRHNKAWDNRVISARQAADGSVLGGNWRADLVLWDYYDGSATGDWGDNRLSDNKVNVVGKGGSAARDYLPSLGGSNIVTGTTDPLGRLATPEDELTEYQYWLQKLAVTSVHVGCWDWKRC